MRIKTFTLNSKQEVISKIVREILNLFKVEITGSCGEADYLQLSVVNHQLTPSVDGTGKGVTVESRLMLFDLQGNLQEYSFHGEGKGDEREAAARHRLIKLNLYHIFRKHLGTEAAPWGILHGVRPTKIIHRWIRGGGSQQEILARIQEDYACSAEKANIIVPMAFRQLPFLQTSDERTVSIYVGIPFCLTRCLYCSFPANILPGEKQLRQFMDVFRRDLAAGKRAVEQHGFEVQNIYVGGGTPTSLPDEFFAEMLEMVYNAFYGENLVEFTVEAGRPDSITLGKIEAMKQFKVSRVSVNPQTMQQRTLKLIGRQHTPVAVEEMFHALRGAVPHINMDLILGLPGEKAEDVRDTLEKVTALEPDDITLHALAIKRGSRLKLLMEERHVELPSDEETRRPWALWRGAAISPITCTARAICPGIWRILAAPGRGPRACTISRSWRNTRPLSALAALLPPKSWTIRHGGFARCSMPRIWLHICGILTSISRKDSNCWIRSMEPVPRSNI